MRPPFLHGTIFQSRDQAQGTPADWLGIFLTFEYVHGGPWHTNTVENYFSILTRGVVRVYHHVSQLHLKRYVGEFDSASTLKAYPTRSTPAKPSRASAESA